MKNINLHIENHTRQKQHYFKVHNDILESLDNGDVAVLVMLDLSAFDTLDHTTILHRFEQDFGISRQALNWMNSYLSERHQIV